MDFNPNSATNPGTDIEEDELVEALKTRLGPLALLCLVTGLNLINGFFPTPALKPAEKNEQTTQPINASQIWLRELVPKDKEH